MTVETAIESIKRYRDHRIETGSCLRAILENDLRWAIAKADESTLGNLVPIVLAAQLALPEEAWGSHEKVEAWLSKK